MRAYLSSLVKMYCERSKMNLILDYLIDFMLLAMIYLALLFRKWNRKKELLLYTLMYVYIVLVFFVTLMPFTISILESGTNNLFVESANLIPFRDLKANYTGAEMEIVLNVIMMIPFGFLYPVIRGKGILNTVVLTLLFSLFIEGSQLLSTWWGSANPRSFDVTDLITNTFGGLIGYFIYIIFKPHIHRILKEESA